MFPFQQTLPGLDPADGPTSSSAIGSPEPMAHKKQPLGLLRECPLAPQENFSQGSLLHGIGLGIKTLQDEVPRSPSIFYQEGVFHDSAGPDDGLEAIPQPNSPTSKGGPHWFSPLASDSSDSDGGRSFSVPPEATSPILSQEPGGSVSETQDSQYVCKERVSGTLQTLNYKFNYFDGELLQPKSKNCATVSSDLQITHTSVPASLSETRGRTHEPRRFDTDDNFCGSGSDIEGPQRASLCSNYDLTLAVGVSRIDLSSDETSPIFGTTLVDDPFKSCTPNRSQKRNSSARNQDVQYLNAAIDNASSSRNSGKSVRAGKGRGKNKMIDGSDQSEDEDARDEEGVSAGGSSSKPNRLFACPFFRKDPQKHKECGKVKSLTRISYVKDHLKKKHYQQHCPLCYFTGGTYHDCHPKSEAPSDWITEEKFRAIDRRADKTKSHEEQWHYLYGVLFQNEQPSSHPFLKDAETERRIAINFFLSKSQQLKKLREELYSAPYGGAQRDRIWEQALPGIFDELLSGNKDELPKDDQGIQEGTECSGLFDFGPPITFDLLDTGSSQQGLTIAPSLISTASPTSMTEALYNLQVSGETAPWLQFDNHDDGMPSDQADPWNHLGASYLAQDSMDLDLSGLELPPQDEAEKPEKYFGC